MPQAVQVNTRMSHDLKQQGDAAFGRRGSRRPKPFACCTSSPRTIAISRSSSSSGFHPSLTTKKRQRAKDESAGWRPSNAGTTCSPIRLRSWTFASPITLLDMPTDQLNELAFAENTGWTSIMASRPRTIVIDTSVWLDCYLPGQSGSATSLARARSRDQRDVLGDPRRRRAHSCRSRRHLRRAADQACPRCGSQSAGSACASCGVSERGSVATRRSMRARRMRRTA